MNMGAYLHVQPRLQRCMEVSCITPPAAWAAWARRHRCTAACCQPDVVAWQAGVG